MVCRIWICSTRSAGGVYGTKSAGPDFGCPGGDPNFLKMSLAITTLGISETRPRTATSICSFVFSHHPLLFFHFPFCFPLPLFPSRSMHLIPTVLRSQTHTHTLQNALGPSLHICHLPHPKNPCSSPDLCDDPLPMTIPQEPPHSADLGDSYHVANIVAKCP